MMIADDLVMALKQLKLEIDCFEMALVQNRPDSPVSYKGKGYIRQTENDTLTFKLYASETKNIDAIRYMRLVADSGRLFTASEHVWIAERILPDCDWTSSTPNPIVTGNIWAMSSFKSSPSSKHRLRLHFFDDAQLPYSVGVRSTTDGVTSYAPAIARFSSGDADFEVRGQDSGFVVEATSNIALNETLPTRIQEAMRYITAKSLTYRVVTRDDTANHYVEIRSASSRAAKTNLPPPLATRGHPSYSADEWRLFSCYLQYVMRGTTHPYMSRCSYYLHNACEASAGSFDLFAVGVGVAVEGIANMIFSEPSPEEKIRLERLRQSVLDHIAPNPCFHGLTDRVRGLFGMMFNVSVQERLRTLVKSGHVDATHIEAWKKLRHKHVHPKEIDLQKMTLGDYQELLDLIHKVTVLMYHITFFLIGYEGKYTDYATRKWPARNYPLSINSVSPPQASS
jgi:hypothetical protein